MLPHPATISLFFYGDSSSPFLAPRGVWVHGGKLFVSDTAQNRVFVWHKLPRTSYQAPDLVLGQEATTHTGRNAGGSVSSVSMQYPSGLWSNGQRLVVADAWNHRVLVWNRFPEANGQPADVVIGQPDLQQNQPNVKGLTAKPGAQTLYWPYGLWSDGRQLWIADTGNRRVLHFEQFPEEHFTPADRVLGQPTFEDKDYDPQFAVWPYSVSISADGKMAISDTQYYRVMVWNHWQDAAGNPPDCLFGQQNLSDNGVNRNQLQPGADTLNWTYQAVWGKGGLWVADTGNSRALFLPNGEAPLPGQASHYLGTVSPHAIGEFDTQNPANSERMYWPFSLCQSQGVLAVADTGNHRIVFYET